MYIREQEIVIVLLLISCGICIGTIWSIADFLKLVCARVFYRVIIDTIVLAASSTIFIYVVYITSDFDIRLTNLMLIVLGYILYEYGPKRLIQSLSPKINNVISTTKTTRIFRYIFK